MLKVKKMASDIKVNVKIPQVQAPGFYHRKVGDIVVTTVSDGYLDGDVAVLTNIKENDAKKLLSDQYRPARRTSVNCFLIFSADRIALVDTGCGPYMGATAGFLFDNLKALGVKPEDIDTVLLTHLHPDHAGGLTVIETGEKRFPNAEIVVHEKEFAHWHDTAEQTRAEGIQGFFFEPAQNHMAPYRDDALRFFREGEVFPGVHAIECPGHTPGHSSFLVESGDEQLIIWGDTIHVQEIQISNPEVGVAFDTDQNMAIETRRKIFDRVAVDQVLAGGMHIHFPGFGRISREGSGFQLYQEAWVHNLRGTDL
jgi:glyoxylase-like metal-dependent hydrolase (beta-lactamase superfamily II)